MKAPKKSKGIPQAIFVIFAFLFIPLLINWFGIVVPSSDDDYIPYDYEITQYHVEMELNEKNSMTVEEQITVLHNEHMHGIVRAIPKLQTVTYESDGKKQSKNYLVEIVFNQSNKPYSVYEDDGVYYFRLGNENSYVVGIQNYEFSYTVNMGNDRIKEFDQFYYNILGNYWDTTVSDLSFRLTLPHAVNTDKVMNLYYGEYGSVSSVQLLPDLSGKIYQASIDHTFLAGEGLTARVVLQQGYFLTPRADIIAYIVIYFLLGIAAFVAVVLFLANNNKKVLTPVVNFESPDGLLPSEVGYVIDGSIDNKDISSLIVYWAQKGYLKIINKATTDKKEDFYIAKVKDSDDSMKNYEKKIFNAMFTGSDEIALNKIGEKIWPQVAVAKTEISNKHETKNFKFSNNLVRGILLFASAFALAGITRIINVYAVHIWNMLICVVLAFVWYGIGFAFLKAKDNSYIKNQKVTRIVLSIVAAIILVAYAFLTYDTYTDMYYLTFAAIIFAASTMFMAAKINIRTDYGMDLLGQILGFKQFIEFAEKDRIKMLVKEDPEMFFDILPYAYVLGVSDEWIKNFDGIVINTPNWYVSSNSDPFLNYIIFRSMFNSMMLSTSASMIAPKVNGVKSSGIGGGFGGFGSGGGFTGGGFGGGGGRGW